MPNALGCLVFGRGDSTDILTSLATCGGLRTAAAALSTANRGRFRATPRVEALHGSLQRHTEAVLLCV